MIVNIVIVERYDSSKNQVFEFESYYQAWCTYYYYKERIGFGRTKDDVIVNVKLE